MQVDVIMAQKTILELIFRNSRLTQLLIYLVFIITYIISLVIELILNSKFEITIIIGTSLNKTGYLMCFTLSVFFLFKMRTLTEKYINSMDTTEEKKVQILENLFSIEDNYAFLDKIINKLPLKKHIGRIGILVFSLGGYFLLKIIPFILSPPTYLMAMNQLVIQIGWFVYWIIFTDLILIGFNLILLPKKLVNKKCLDAPILYHIDGNFGYSKYGNFSFKIYLFFFIIVFSFYFLFIWLAWYLLILGNVDSFIISVLTASLSLISVNILLLFFFLTSLKHYKSIIIKTKTMEIEKITNMINELIKKNDENIYWQIYNLYQLRDKIDKARNIPINTSIIKKIVISFSSFLLTSFLLPNLLLFF